MRCNCWAIAVLALVAPSARADDDAQVTAVRALVRATGENAFVYATDGTVWEVGFGRDTTDNDLKALAALAPPRLYKVELHPASALLEKGKPGVTRAGLKALAALPALRSLVAPKGCGDEDVKEIAALPHLEVLHAYSADFGDEGIKHLAAALKLKVLSLPSFRRFTDTVWEPLSKIATLEEVDGLYGKQLTGRGVGRLAALKKLRRLELWNLSLADGVCDEIARLKGLRQLKLSHASVTDDGVKALASLPELWSLDLTETKITDAALRHLAAAPKLEQLRLGSTAVTDAGIRELTALATLLRLDVSGTKVTGVGVVDFKEKASPYCEVITK